MRRALTWLAGAVGLAALARLRARRRAATAAVPTAATDDPADQLRRRLAEQRDGQAVAERTDRTATDVEIMAATEADDEPVDLAARRAEVHTRAQAAIDLMRDETERAPGNGAGGDPVA